MQLRSRRASGRESEVRVVPGWPARASLPPVLRVNADFPGRLLALVVIIESHGISKTGHSGGRRTHHNIRQWHSQVPDRPILPFIEGDGTGPDIWRASVRVSTRRWKRNSAAKENRLDRGLRRREGQEPVGHLAARRDARGLQDLSGRHQGPADHADRRRHPLAQRRHPPDAGSLRVPAPGALLRGRALPVKRPEKVEHGDLPREHRGHLRGHRMGGRVARGQEAHRVPAERDGREARSAFPAPRASASSRYRARAPNG